MAFQTNQIYDIVNEAAQQALGQQAIQAIDTSSMISLGNTVLSSEQNVEAFLNVLPQRIGRTIFSYRAYRNKFGDMVRNDFEMGAILQKIKVKMPSAVEDPTYSLTNGQSVDQWKVYKPDVSEKLFVKRTPYVYPITIQRVTLREAFLSEQMMGSFISYVFGEVRNAIEYGMENLSRMAIANFIAESKVTVNLVSIWNNKYPYPQLTAETALKSEPFLRFMVQQIKSYSKRMTDMSVIFNNEGETRFTPFDRQRLYVLAEVQNVLETEVLYSAFHENYVGLQNFNEINFWQSETTPGEVIVTKASDEKETTVSNVVACLMDWDALGIYQIEEEVLTTPVNALARYYNTFYHLRQLWFNDLSENFVLFTLN